MRKECMLFVCLMMAIVAMAGNKGVEGFRKSPINNENLSTLPAGYAAVDYVQAPTVTYSTSQVWAVPNNLQENYNYIFEFTPLLWEDSYYGLMIGGNNAGTVFPKCGIFKLDNGWGGMENRFDCAFWNYNLSTIYDSPGGNYRVYTGIRSKFQLHCKNYDQAQGAEIVVENEGHETYSHTSTTVYGNDYSVQTGVYDIPLFTTKDGNIERAALMQLHNFKVEDKNGIAIYDYVPCIRNSDSKVGLYDVVNDAFYYPSAFDLIAGPNETVNSTPDESQIAEAIDLGLSVKWASWNVGADKPEGLGNLYAWGELTPKDDYSTSTYKFYDGGYTKYGSVDEKYRLDNEDDVAQQMWGDKWRIPTFEELQELHDNCTFTPTELNGVPVTKVTGPNGNFIYFPYPGNYTGSNLYCDNSVGSYWSCDLQSDYYAKDLDFSRENQSLNGDYRYHGQSVRPVYIGEDLYKMAVSTLIFDANSQPMLVGGYIDGFSKQLVRKKGIIVSKNLDDMFITDDTKFYKSEVIRKDYYDDDNDNKFDSHFFDIKFIDCTDTNEEEYACALQFLMGNTDYFVKAYVIDKDNNILYGNIEKVHTQDYNRYSGFNDYANVWYAFDHTLFDLVTDEIIDPKNGFYYSTNENPTTVRFQTGTGYNTCYKFNTEWNYKLWYYHGWYREYWDNHNQSNYVPLHIPVMKYSNGKLTIEKNPLDSEKDITIYYSIDGNYFRPDYFNNVYTQPLELTEPCTVYCYAICENGTVSYTNLYRVGEVIIDGNDLEEIEVTDISQMNNIIYIEPMKEMCGKQAIISLKMKNTAAIRGFQFDLYLPEGVTVVKSSKGKIQGELSVGRLPDEDEHTLTFSEQADGAIRFLCSSQYDETFTGNDGEIATLRVNIANDMADGDYPLQLKNIKLTETDISKYYETPLVKCKLTIKSYILGDINSDGVVDVSDYTGVANHIHGNTPEGFVTKAGDVDGSGTIDVSDYTGIANIIHTGSIYGSNASRAMSRSPKKANTDINANDNVIYIEPFTIAPGTQTVVSIKMKNTAAIRGFQFDLYLPEGMTAVKSPKGRIQGALNASRLPEDDGHDLTFSEQQDGAIRFLCSSQYDETFTGNNGEIATLQVAVADNMTAGDYPIVLKNIKLTETDISKYYLTEKLETTVTVNSAADERLLLDEVATEDPDNAIGADVRVVRTIAAGNWSTICLPFAMTEEQVKAAFGDGVQLGDFTSWSSVKEGGNVVGINVGFTTATAIEANHPYIIKVEEPVTEFTVDGVNISAIAEPKVQVGTKASERGYMYGTYTVTKVPEENVFLSGNKFYYSVGDTSIKAFRAYFEFRDVLDAYYDVAEARITFSLDGNTLGTTLVNSVEVKSDGVKSEVYNLNGQRVSKAGKGVYIVNGKKVVKK